MTRVKLSVEARFFRIPTRWEIDQAPPQEFYRRHQFNGKQLKGKKKTVPVAVPSFTDNVGETKLVEVDGWELRNRFLQMKQTAESAISFLQEVGVWAISEDEHVTIGLDEGALSGAFGARLVRGWAVPVSLSQLWEVQRYYRELLANADEIRRKFGPSPPADAPITDKTGFAVVTTFENTLPMHIEWRRGHATAVVEAITCHEMLMVTTQMDLLRGARFRYCQRPDCHIPFPVTTEHRKIYCSWYCGHIEAVRRTRKGQKGEKRRVRVARS